MFTPHPRRAPTPRSALTAGRFEANILSVSADVILVSRWHMLVLVQGHLRTSLGICLPAWGGGIEGWALDCAAGELSIHFRTFSRECPPGTRGSCALCVVRTLGLAGNCQARAAGGTQGACPHAGTHPATLVAPRQPTLLTVALGRRSPSQGPPVWFVQVEHEQWAFL